jgi:hypothetical protein
VARGSKHMFLELIHGLFITLTEFRLSTTFIPIIIIMHIYTTGIIHCCNHSIIYIGETDYVHDFPFAPLVSPIAPFHLLGTLLAVTGSVHLFLGLLEN